jgi:hypothetical protein
MSLFFVSISKEERTSLVLAMVLTIIGYGISMVTCSDVFPMFGALIVCVGVLFSIKGLPTLLDDVESSYEGDIEKARNNIQASIPDGHPDKGKIREQLESDIAKAQRTMHYLKMRIFRIEGGIIIAGTIIWGFGDYVVYGKYLSPECC